MKVRFLVIAICLILLPFSTFSENSSVVIQKSPLDTREYAYVVLENGLKVVVVSDKNTPTAGAAIVVKAGLYDDPKAFPGLAHFLEHMLFLGTQKYPVPDEFQNFIQAHGGDRNAMTEGEHTRFFFSVQPEAFEPALVRFADFFISPALYPEYVDRELNAVDQEFHLYLHQDSWAGHEVNKETSNPEHPFYHYFGGNLQTLGYDKQNLPKVLRAFFNQHYHANNMTLALVGPQSTKELLNLAKQNFSQIAKTPYDYSHEKRASVYSQEQLGLDIFMKAKGQSQSLTLTFPLEHEANLIKQKSKHLVAAVIGHDGRGGLSLALKRAKWITDLEATYQRLSQEQDALIIDYSLTDEGLKHIDDITRYTYSYISLLQARGIPEHFFTETKTINQWYFRYLEKQESSQLALALASTLLETPAEALLTSHFLLPSDPISKKAISHVLKHLTPQNMRRTIVSANVEGDTISKWYQANYRVVKIAKEQMNRFANMSRFSTFKLPERNRFMPTDLVLMEKPQSKQEMPEKLRDDNLTLWHHQDVQFEQPKGSILINFNVPWAVQSPESALLTKLYCKMVLESLREEFYPAALAGASISMMEHSRGITLAISGYSDKQEALLNDVLHSIKSFTFSSDQFIATKEHIARNLKNFDQRTLGEKAQVELSTLLFSPTYHPNELLPVSQTLTQAQLVDFKALFWKNSHVEMLVHGNYNKEQAKQFAMIVEQVFPSKPRADEVRPGIKIAELKKKAKHYRKIASRDKNHVVMWYLQNSQKDYDTLAKTMLFSNLLEVPYFQALRVDKQLAYTLGAHPYSLKKVSGMMFWIQSAKAEPNILLKEIKQFLTNFQLQLAKMDEETFRTSKEALIMQVRQPAQTLGEQTQRWWGVIENGESDFEHNEKLAKALEKVKRADLALFAQNWLAKQDEQGQLFVLSSPLAPVSNEKEIVSIKEFRESAPFVG